MAISTELATELKAVLGRLREARDNDPKHGTIAGAPDCGKDCTICFTEHHFNYLIDQIPRPVPEGILSEALSQIEVDGHLAPRLGVQFIAPWPIKRQESE